MCAGKFRTSCSGSCRQEQLEVIPVIKAVLIGDSLICMGASCPSRLYLTPRISACREQVRVYAAVIRNLMNKIAPLPSTTFNTTCASSYQCTRFL